MPTQDGYGRAKRLNDLERMLLSQPERQWRTSEVAQRLGVSEDTAMRDIQELSGTALEAIRLYLAS